MKDLHEFATLVKQMRDAQKHFFDAQFGSLSKNNWLSESKSLEKKVDAAIKQIEDPQVKLF